MHIGLQSFKILKLQFSVLFHQKKRKTQTNISNNSIDHHSLTVQQIFKKSYELKYLKLKHFDEIHAYRTKIWQLF